MKLKHVVFLAFAVMGILFIAHNYMSHGGVSGVKSGLGFGG